MLQFETMASAITRDPATGYDQKVRRLAALALSVLPYPALSADCCEALDKRVICDMYEGNTPFTPRYVLPDYARAMRQGSPHLELDPPRDLDEALSFLTIMYGHVPSVTTYPVYLGDLDSLLEPYVGDLTDAELDRRLRRFW
ncbi:MAG TPA: glycyl radical enzyme domain-containing protein, partial [Candidatus Lustribacter sp.]|nr:glycyl radical enzyme domain-containing protein [Candidatus Lustribacter sp.]